MTSRPPGRRLTDVLTKNSKRNLERHAAEMLAAATSLPPEATQTRFLRNSHLISPKALFLLNTPETLAHWHVFGVYKPPFCPMRRTHAHENYHNVSVESFVKAAVNSRDVMPTLQGTLSPREVHVRVLNDVDILASGPVVVSVCDRHSLATSLEGLAMEYELLVAGHLPLTGPKKIPTELLFTSVAKAVETPTSCEYAVKRNAYYCTHAVSLIGVTITAPPSPAPPSIEQYVREHLGSFVLGDPIAMGEMLMEKGRQRNRSAQSTSATSPLLTMRGDCDFPRVFTHLREVRITPDKRGGEADVGDGGTDGTDDVITFHCNRCFDSLLQPARLYKMKNLSLGLLDGTWTPASEYL